MKHPTLIIAALLLACPVIESADASPPSPSKPGARELQQSWTRLEPGVPRQIALWPDGRGPVDAHETEPANACLDIYRPAKPNGTAMVVCAGGGYGRNLWQGAEGVGTAEWLNRQGITAALGCGSVRPRAEQMGDGSHHPVVEWCAEMSAARARLTAPEGGCGPPCHSFHLDSPGSRGQSRRGAAATP